MAHEPFHATPIVVPMSSLLAVGDIAQVSIPGTGAVEIMSISASCRLLTSGTATLTVKNDAASTITSIALAAASVVNGTLSIGSINGGDKLHFGFSGIGIGLQDVTATVWLKMPSTA